MDPHLFGNLERHPDPDPRQSDMLDPDPDPHQSDKLDPELDPYSHQFADDQMYGI
jgi:hypothetical protein